MNLIPQGHYIAAALALINAAAAAALYVAIHEFSHYIATRLVGCSARLGTGSDSLLASPSVIVGECKGLQPWRRVLILYAPYVANIALLLGSGWLPLRAVAVLTLPNLLLENGRDKRRLFAAAAACLALAAWLVLTRF